MPRASRRVSLRDAVRSCERGALCANARQASEGLQGYEARLRARHSVLRGPAFTLVALWRGQVSGSGGGTGVGSDVKVRSAPSLRHLGCEGVYSQSVDVRGAVPVGRDAIERAVAACVDIVFVYSQCEWASACKRTSDDGWWNGGIITNLLTRY